MTGKIGRVEHTRRKMFIPRICAIWEGKFRHSNLCTFKLEAKFEKKKEKPKWYEHQDYNSGYVIISDPAKEEKKIVY